MTAIIVDVGMVAEAEARAGTQFSVALGRDGEVTHLGCNWADCPKAALEALAQIEGVTVGEDFWALCGLMGIGRIEPATI